MKLCKCYSWAGNRTIIDSNKLETAFGSQDNANKFYKNIGFVKLMKMKMTKRGNLHYQRQSRLQLSLSVNVSTQLCSTNFQHNQDLR